LPPDKWSGSTIGNVPIGQGIAVTPMQMASAYAAIANRGVWVRPHLVERIGDGLAKPIVRRRIVTPWISRELTSMLQNVVLDGTGTLAQIPGYHVAGKTGTASKPDSQGYSTSKYVASFVGFAPATRPRVVVLVAVDEPHGAIFGGVVAAPAFKAIMQQALQYLSSPPDAATTSTP
jgi:cell division protein FtsI/penicillin-binding protein 2